MALAAGNLLTSIIIPCFNKLEFTRHCLRTLFRYKRPPLELIVVDNGSTHGTGTYLAGVQDAWHAPVTTEPKGDTCECHFLERKSLMSNDLRSEYRLY